MMNENEILVHHGIKGQRWGVRRFQNEDGTRTAAGKKRERQLAGSGKLMERNESTAARKYKEAKAAEKRELGNIKTDENGNEDWEDYDRRTNEALDARKQAFKESKAAFKANKTLGQKVANQILNGPIGAGVYNNMRASGHSVAASEATVIASTILAGPLGQAAAYLITRKG